MSRKLDNIFDNRWVQRFIPIVAIYHLVESIRSIRKQNSIIQETINNNTKFYEALATIGFAPRGLWGELIAIMPYEPGLSPQDITDIANKTIIGVIMKYVNDESLFGILQVECKIEKNDVIVIIRPVAYQHLLTDIIDLLLGLIFWSSSIIGTMYFL